MLWRSAPLRLLRAPGWLLLVLGAATLFVASVVAPPLFAATARSTALADALEASRGAPYGSSSGDVRVTWDAMLTPEAEAVVRERIEALTGYDDPVLGAAGVGQSRTLSALAVANGRQWESELWYRDGAVTALGGDEDAPGVWLAEDVADKLGLEVGDKLRIGMAQTFFGRHKSLAPTVLAGTYETAPGSDLPAVLAAQPDAERWFLPPDTDDPSVTTPLAIAGRADFDRLLAKAGDTPLYLADLRLDPDITPDDAATAVKDIQTLADDAFDSSTSLGQVLANTEPMPAQLQVLTGLPDIVFAADFAATSARDQVTPYGVAGQVLAAALLVAAWVLLGRTRRREQLLATGLGLRPLEVAGQAGLEALPVALVSLPAGLALAVLGVVTAGPPTDGGVTITQDDLVRAALAAGAALLLITVTAGLAAAATDRMDRVSRLGRSRRVVPLTAALLVATAAVAVAVFTTDLVNRSSTPVTMAFPVLVAASVAVVVARSVTWLRGRLPGRSRPGSARWLASRRTGPVVREVTALSAVVAIALGLFGYALTAHRGIEEGVADKTAAVAGATTVIQVAEDFRAGGMKRAVTPPGDGTSIVWRRGVALPPNYGNQPLMAIDPASFDAVADWGASGDLEEARAAALGLDERAKGLAVVLAGDTDAQVGDQGMLDFSSEFQIPIRVVGVTAAFPGSETETGNVTVITSARRLFRLVAPTVDPRRKKSNSGEAGVFTSEVWSDDTAAGLRHTLAEAGVSTDGNLVTSTQAGIAAGLTASTWAAGYVLALGVVMLVLALGGALVLALRLADRDAVSDVLLARMGVRAPELARARAWEVAYAVVTALLAALAAGAVLVATPTIVDATAALPPLARPRPDLVDVAVMVLAVAAMVLVAWLVGAQRAGRRHPAEVLRGGG